MSFMEALGIARKPQPAALVVDGSPEVPAADRRDELVARLLEQLADRDIEVGQLKTAVAVAEAASVAKLQFLANMSHELRTPLNAIVGYALLLHEDAVAAGRNESMEDLDRIIRAARHLVGLINDILDIS